MKHSLLAACVAAFALTAVGAAHAQNDAMSNGAMAKDAMSKDAMSKDGMKKDAMAKDGMKKDHMSKDGMKKPTNDDKMSPMSR
jgi:pentapeptide MXKDX repeat protein